MLGVVPGLRRPRPPLVTLCDLPVSAVAESAVQTYSENASHLCLVAEVVW
jgi:hypothetical protein